jgi:hypothetical protein
MNVLIEQSFKRVTFLEDRLEVLLAGLALSARGGFLTSCRLPRKQREGDKETWKL